MSDTRDIFRGVEALTFDCYGTIIDWEHGIVAALRSLLGAGVDASDDELLERYGRLEPRAQAGDFRPYREVLHDVARAFGHELDVPVDDDAADRFADSVGKWPPFDDSVAALRSLGERFRLVIVSNIDDDLFEDTRRGLGIDFHDVITAQQVRSYKPERGHFDEVLRRLSLPVDRIVHVAQSLFHDVAPAKELGFTCVWVDRRQGRSGAGATPPAEATPDLTVPDLATLARAAGV